MAGSRILPGPRALARPDKQVIKTSPMGVEQELSEEEDQQASLWRALANPVRRQLLDLLRDGPRTTGDLAGHVPGLSRFAVMQHLGVLADAGLVIGRRRGRERFHHLNAVPLRQGYERWVSRFADDLARHAVELQRHVEQIPTLQTNDNEEGPSPMSITETARVVRIENEIRLRAPIDRVFAAMTTEQAAWYPYNYGGDRLEAIVFEQRVGGSCYEDWGDGRGTVYGTITYFDPPAAYCMRGHLRGGVSLEHWYTFTADGDATVLSQSLTAFGPISEDDAEGIRTHGDLTRVEPQLRAYLEG